MKFLPFCCVTSLITSLGVLVVTILSLNNLSYLNGVKKEVCLLFIFYINYCITFIVYKLKDLGIT